MVLIMLFVCRQRPPTGSGQRPPSARPGTASRNAVGAPPGTASGQGALRPPSARPGTQMRVGTAGRPGTGSQGGRPGTAGGMRLGTAVNRNMVSQGLGGAAPTTAGMSTSSAFVGTCAGACGCSFVRSYAELPRTQQELVDKLPIATTTSLFFVSVLLKSQRKLIR